MRGTVQETRTETERDLMRGVSKRTIRGGGKLISGSLMAGLAILARTIGDTSSTSLGTPTAVLIWVVFAIGLLLAIWGIFERVEA